MNGDRTESVSDEHAVSVSAQSVRLWRFRTDSRSVTYRPYNPEAVESTPGIWYPITGDRITNGIPLVRDEHEQGAGIGRPHHSWSEMGVLYDGAEPTHIARPVPEDELREAVVAAARAIASSASTPALWRAINRLDALRSAK